MKEFLKKELYSFRAVAAILARWLLLAVPIGPPLGDVLHGQVERCADGTADEAGGDGQQQPAGQDGRDGPEGIKLLFQKFFHDNTPVFFISCPQR
jgi:hypothetical protein